jgi:NADH-quinone oxidoreductase subunit J
MSPEASSLRVVPANASVTNTEALGQVLYTNYVYLFQGAGLILLIAMVGAIVLTLRRRPGVRKQSISVQVARTPADTLAVVKVEVGKGLS